ncbi:MAG: hypothetical protein ACI9G1_003810, partial [Pirellulaceae bacterium]
PKGAQKRKKSAKFRLAKIVPNTIGSDPNGVPIFGDDPYSGENYDHRKQWIEDLTRAFAQFFAIDVIAVAIIMGRCGYE